MAAGPPEAWCWQVLRERRWPKGVVCTYCHTGRVERHRQCGWAFHYRCRSCRRIFSDRTATPFGGTKISLSAWFLAIGLMDADPERRPPSLELAEILQVSLKTARRMRRTLLALREDPFIRSIRARMVLWMNEREQGKGDPPLGGRNGDPGSDDRWNEMVALSARWKRPPPSPPPFRSPSLNEKTGDHKTSPPVRSVAGSDREEST